MKVFLQIVAGDRDHHWLGVPETPAKWAIGQRANRPPEVSFSRCTQRVVRARQCKFRQQVLAGHRPQSTEAERLRDQDRDPRKFQGNTRAVLQLLTLISRHRLLSRWGPFLLPSPAAAIEDTRRY